MRVTEHRLIELSTSALGKARERAAKAGQELSSGVAVGRPSDDPQAWAEGKVAQVRGQISEGHATAIDRSRAKLADAEGIFTSIGDSLSRVQELAIQISNGGLSDEDREGAALEIAGIRDSIRAQANTKGGDGEFVLAGSTGDTRPFEDNGLFIGTSDQRRVAVGEEEEQVGTISGAVLTEEMGVDVLGMLDDLAQAMRDNDPVRIRELLAPVEQSIDQVATARSEVGVRMNALTSATDARDALEQRLTDTIDRSLAADPIKAATELAEASGALEAARAAAQKMIEMAGG
jgi:flagellar hook-associated protein 3 FlgL